MKTEMNFFGPVGSVQVGDGNVANVDMSLAPMAPRLTVIDAVLKGFGPNIAHLSGANVLITGARGFFGRYLVDVLIEANARKLTAEPINIHALDSLATGGDRRTLDWLGVPNLTIHYHDVKHGYPDIIAGKLTHVWHLAGIASPYWYKKLPEETIAVSVDGTRSMLQLAKEQGAKFMFTSSSEVYQTATIVPTPETFIGAIPSLSERSCYDVSKLMAETLCYIAATRERQHVSMVRIFNSFGPGMGEADRRILPRLASALVSGKPLTVFRPSDMKSLPRRTYTPVANTLLGFLLVAVKGESLNSQSQRLATGVYNIGLDKPEVTVPELINLVTQVTKRELKYEIRPAPEHYETEPMRRCPDVSALRSLGWQPCMDLETGIFVFVSWALGTYEGLS